MRKLTYHAEATKETKLLRMEERIQSQRSPSYAPLPHRRARRLQEIFGLVPDGAEVGEYIKADGSFHVEMTDMLLEKLRRLSTVLMRLKFAEHLKEAITYIEQGHIRVGPETVTELAFPVTRNMEDFVPWLDTSKIKGKVLQYNEKLDDYDAMNRGEP